MEQVVLYRIPDHPTYFVTKDGCVYSMKTNGSFCKLAARGRNGYNAVHFCDDKREWKYVHRIIAEMFIENPLNKPEVDHIDTNRKNNNVTNLRWVDRKENSNNPITIEHYKMSNREKARAKFLFSPEIIPIDLNPMDNLVEMLKSLSIGDIYRISQDYYKFGSLSSTCSKLKKEGYFFKILNYPEFNYSLIRRTK